MHFYVTCYEDVHHGNLDLCTCHHEFIIRCGYYVFIVVVMVFIVVVMVFIAVVMVFIVIIVIIMKF